MLLALLSLLWVGAPPALTGIVVDQSGRPVPSATIAVLPAGREAAPGTSVTAGLDGRFVLPLGPRASSPLNIKAEAPGFGARTLAVDDPSQQLRIVLQPAPVTETVTVTATGTRQRSADVPASITVLGATEIRESPGVVADDVLRQVPAFSLFRRTSSLISHPTTQGVSLRGIGPSGVSRTLVLVDDVPVNDPFGGWVYWSRIPLETAARVEVVDSPESSLYGNYAMGGVINVVTEPPTPGLLDARVQYGSAGTPRADAAIGTATSRFGALVSGSALTTDGYVPVAPAERGAIDQRATLRYGTLSGRADYRPSPGVTLFARGTWYGERRGNGKHSSINGLEEANRTRTFSVTAGASARQGEGELKGLVSADVETFNSNFLAVPAANPPRSVARLTLTQRVPVTGVTTNVSWLHPAGARHMLSAGGDWRFVSGDSRETGYDAVSGTTPTLYRVSGGRQQLGGGYVQDLFTPATPVVLTLGARVDAWRNYGGHNLETAAASGLPTSGNVPALPSRTDAAVSPRAAALVRVHPGINVWGSVAGGFRAPTLNELYRQFRVGTTLTLANSALGPERLRGFEAGTSFDLPRTVLRVTWFDNRLSDAVSNVTIAVAGALVTQQRQNLGATRVRGLQADAEVRAARSLTISAAIVTMDSAIVENAHDPALVGHVLPEVPRARASAHVTWSPRFATIAGGLQVVGSQFDDDLNTPSRRLPGYALVDLTLLRRVRTGLDLFAAVANLLDERYETGTLPTTIGVPRQVAIGLRVTSGRR